MATIRMKVIAIILLVTSWSVFCRAQDDLFDDASRAYALQDYPSAIAAYERILFEGYESPELFFNLGNACDKAGYLGKSILYFEKALRLDPNNRNAHMALSYVKKKVGVQITEIPDFLPLRWYRSIVGLLSSDVWAIAQVVICVIGLALLFMVLFKSFLPGSARWIVLFLTTLFFVATFCFAYQKRNWENGNTAAIVMDQSTSIFIGPDERSDRVADVSEGVKVYILGKIGSWYKVRLADRDVGWIKSDLIEII